MAQDCRAIKASPPLAEVMVQPGEGAEHGGQPPFCAKIKLLCPRAALRQRKGDRRCSCPERQDDRE